MEPTWPMPALLTRMSRRVRRDAAAAMEVGLVDLGGDEGVGEGFGGGEVDVGDPDEGAGADEFADGGLADAAGAAGDQGVTVVEAKGLGLGLGRGRFKIRMCRAGHGRGLGGIRRAGEVYRVEAHQVGDWGPLALHGALRL
jgi:hypothetical protein